MARTPPVVIRTRVDNRKANKDLRTFAASGSASLLAIKGAAVAAGTAIAGIAAATAAVVKGINDLAGADSIQKMALRLGESASTIEALQIAAKRSGGEVRMMDQALLALSRRATAMPKTFERWGIATRDVNGVMLSTWELMASVADRIQRATSQSERLAIAQDLMSEAGRKLVPMFQDGAAGLDRLTEAARKSGAVITEFEANAGAMLADRFGELSEQSTAFSRSLGAVFAPVVDVAGKQIGNVIRAMRNWLVVNREWLQSGIVETLVWFADNVVPAVATGVNIIARAWFGWLMIVEHIEGQINRFLEGLFEMTGGIYGLLAKGAEALGLDVGKHFAGMQRVAIGLSDTFAESAERNNAEILKLETRLKDTETAIGNLGVRAATGFREMARDVVNVTEKLENMQKRVSLSVASTDAAFGLGGGPEATTSNETNSRLIEGERRTASTMLDIWRGYSEQRVWLIRDLVDQGISAQMNLVSNIVAFSNQQSDNQIDAARRAADAEIAQLKRSGATKEQIEARTMAIEKKFDKQRRKLEKEQFERNKALSIVQAIINTAQGVTKALADGGVIGIALGALVAAAGAVQIATIASQSYGGSGSAGSVSTPSLAGGASAGASDLVRPTGTEDTAGTTGGVDSSPITVTVNFNSIVTDPVAAAREVEEVMNGFVPLRA